MYIGDAIYWNVFGLSIGYQLYHGRCAICIVQILYYTCNILLFLIKQILGSTQYDSNMIMLKQMILNMNLSAQVMLNHHVLSASNNYIKQIKVKQSYLYMRLLR